MINIKVDYPDVDGILPPKTTLHAAAASGLRVLVRRHLIKRNSRPPSREGWPRSNYWTKAADAIQTHSSETQAQVGIRAPGARLHLLGGTVKPKNGKYLAIPMHPSVADVWPSEHSEAGGETFIWTSKKSGKMFIADTTKDGLRLLWLLKSETHHKPDPSVIPTAAELAAAAKNAMISIIPKTPK